MKDLINIWRYKDALNNFEQLFSLVADGGLPQTIQRDEQLVVMISGEHYQRLQAAYRSVNLDELQRLGQEFDAHE